MVKGISRRVVVIKSPDQKIFDEAIFLIREDAYKNGGVTAEDVVDEACRVAGEYVKKHSDGGQRLRYILPAALAASGACLLTAGWLLARAFV